MALQRQAVGVATASAGPSASEQPTAEEGEPPAKEAGGAAAYGAPPIFPAPKVVVACDLIPFACARLTLPGDTVERRAISPSRNREPRSPAAWQCRRQCMV